jgi:peroxiredoxin Q/BCP
MRRAAVLATALAGGVLSMLAFAPSVAAANMVVVGSDAPNFTLPAQDGNPVSLSDYKGKWVVLYFYSKDMTVTDGKEAHNFQRDQAKFTALNAVVLGVSMDTVDSHVQFCTKEGLSFKLLSDPGHKAIDLYGVLKSINGTKYADRDTFLISPKGKIVKEWKVTDVDKHSDDVQAAIKAGGK